MNIHLHDQELFSDLKNAALGQFLVGSHLYGLNNSLSDIDYLYVYVPSINERSSYKYSHHQLQYKEDGIDHIFVNIFTFVNNLLSGDSTINYELIHSKQLLGTALEYLYTNRKDFTNYKVIRAYNGFARRDLKEFGKQTSIRDCINKVKHAERSSYFAQCLLAGEEIDLQLSRTTIKTFIEEYDLMGYDQLITEIKNLSTQLEFSRKEEIEKRFNDKTLNVPQYMTVNAQQRLDAYLMQLIYSSEFTSRSAWSMDMKVFYEVYEKNNLVNY